MKAVVSLSLAVLFALLPQWGHAAAMNPLFDFGSLYGFMMFLLVIAVIFLICREIVCWYWKINKAMVLLTEIRDSLRGNALSGGRPGGAGAQGLQCPSCGKTDAYYDVYNRLFCPNCKRYVNNP
ncbi:hypothetical protein [Syntrophobacter fumaroxidans]|uniref:Uncharacterized protein n=1 Tax=Syntrophobacter fumaroxidans (strain DSM 10017 / MPOB) TaxID=335543 RepID=A0LKN0_SYNFM|nr:hypothetical protein [Syntrophobacter fumaroxidans]ABK17982.1 hypothetical protein Sfum_2300 [Syntrophobacter fumaroxidans MPOB]